MLEKLNHQFISHIPHAWPSLLGLGVIQMWLAMMMLGLTAAEGFIYNRTHLVSDIGALFTYLLALAFSRRIAPLFEKEYVIRGAMIVMLVGNTAIAIALLVPAMHPMFAMVGLAVAGCGAACMTLCWWELYGALNPKEVAFFYAGSQVVRELTLVLMLGFNDTYRLVLSFALPFVALFMFNMGRRHIQSEHMVPSILHGSASFPWKPLLLIALYSFAYGCGTWLASYTNDIYMHLGILVPSLVVCASVILPWRRFNFSAIYRIILPVAIASLLALLLIPNLAPDVATLFVQTSFTAVFIYVSILLCNLSRRYHISAAWLFSLLNVVHIVFLGIGTLVFQTLAFLVIVVVCIVCIVLVTFIIVSEPTLSSDWNIVLINKGGQMDEETRLEIAVDALAKQHDLSSREKEVLGMLAKGDMPRSIGAALHIAPGTVKAHVQHIYKKIGIHSRDELFDLLKSNCGMVLVGLDVV